MTILVAVKKNNRVFLGADTFTSNGNSVMPDLTDPWKITKLKNAYLATSGYCLLDNIIDHLKATNHTMMQNAFSSKNDVFSFFLELYSELKKNYNLVEPGKDTFGQLYNNFLIATASSIYAVASNISVTEHKQYIAKGAGADYALGCLYGTYDIIDDGSTLVRLALKAACKLNIYCREPLDIIEVKQPKSERPGKGKVSQGRTNKSLNRNTRAKAKNKTNVRNKAATKS